MKKLGLILFTLLMLFLVGVWVWVYLEYGDKPITEIPAWALPFFQSSNERRKLKCLTNFIKLQKE